MPTCALIHAVEPAIAPARAAFRKLWPEAETFDVSDFSLPGDLAAAGALTPVFTRRMRGLADQALARGAAGILYTCSAFGRAIGEAREDLAVPALKPEEAMIEAALARGGRVVVLATFAPTLSSMEQEFRTMAEAQDRPMPALELRYIEGAQAALKEGDAARHDALIAAAADAVEDADSLLLAQFSMAHVAERIAARPGRPVMTSPAAAVGKLRRLLA